MPQPDWSRTLLDPAGALRPTVRAAVGRANFCLYLFMPSVRPW